MALCCLLQVNSKLCPLPNPVPTSKPGAEPRRPPRPINITALAKLSATSANIINVSWAVEVGEHLLANAYNVHCYVMLGGPGSYHIRLPG